MERQTLRKRRPQASRRGDSRDDAKESDAPMVENTSQAQWLIFAVASGGCAALNGVFAKLTTTAMTSRWASSISLILGLNPENKFFDFLVRATMFLLNLLFNLIMWTLFTRALTLATSTTRVSIINTSANFLVTATLSWLVFAENLPPLWFLGAALLVGGSVIIGAREAKEEASTGNAEGEVVLEGVAATGVGEEEEYRDELERDVNK